MIRVGLVGAGRMARHHVRALGESGAKARVVGIADPSASARDELRSETNGARPYESLSRLLDGERPDVVHVCAPAATHGDLARQALEAGCHVYVEKPFASRLSVAEELFRLADERDLRIAAGHQLLYERATARAEALLPALGRIVHVESFFSFHPVRRGTLTPDEQLLDVLPHPTYLLLHFLERAGSGEPPVDLEVDLDARGTVHALLSGEGPTGSLCVTLAGRPVESYVRVVGTNGTVHADYVRNTVQRSIGPGVSGIDKALAPYRLGRQLIFQTTSALVHRIRARDGAYPGLVEIFRAFYDALSTGVEPVSRSNMRETTRVVEAVDRSIEEARRKAATIPAPSNDRRLVVVTGGSGFLGSAVVRRLARGDGCRIRVLARRRPAPWDARPGVEYRTCDLGADPLEGVLEGAECVIHCAAETAGGWKEHERNSVGATERLASAMGTAGVGKLLHVSSLAVLSAEGGEPIGEETPLEREPKGAGPYVWGKLEAERVVARAAGALGIELRIVRPGAIIDSSAFEPPGRLGKRVGNLFVAIGGRGERLGVVELERAADLIAQVVFRFESAPRILHALEPELPTRRELVRRLRERNPDVRVVWIPRAFVRPLGWLFGALQRLRGSRGPTIDLAKIFAPREYDTARVRAFSRGGKTAPTSLSTANAHATAPGTVGAGASANESGGR